MLRTNHVQPSVPQTLPPDGRLRRCWCLDHDGAPLDPAKLPLTPKSRARLARWCARFQKSFETEIDLDAFAAEGRAIARAVKAELPDWSVIYFDEAAAARAKYQGTPATYDTEIP